MVEAGASGLRLIAPAHSTYLAYLDDATARLVPARRVPAHAAGDAALDALFAGADWWEPDEDAAVEAGRDAIAGRACPAGAPRAARGRVHLDPGRPAAPRGPGRARAGTRRAVSRAAGRGRRYFTISRSSTSKTRVAPGRIRGGAPRSP
jgi:hypothetical protein